MRSNEMNDLAYMIGKDMSKEVFVALAQSYMLKNNLAVLNLEFVPPNAGQKNPDWGFKYSCQEMKFKDNNNGAE